MPRRKEHINFGKAILFLLAPMAHFGLFGEVVQFNLQWGAGAIDFNLAQLDSTFLFVLGAAWVGTLVGSVLPDILEPATSSWHHGFFHSWTFLIILGVLLWQLSTSTWFVDLFPASHPTEDAWHVPARNFLAFAIVGYMGHLILDQLGNRRNLPLF